MTDVSITDEIFPSDVPLTDEPVYMPETMPLVVEQTPIVSYTSAPEVVQPVRLSSPVSQEIGRPVYISNPQPPEVGVAAHTPLLTPLGVSPQFTAPTEPWSWIDGNQNSQDTVVDL